MTKSNTIGYVASFPIPEVIRGINSAYLAAKHNPNVEFKVIWILLGMTRQKKLMPQRH